MSADQAATNLVGCDAGCPDGECGRAPWPAIDALIDEYGERARVGRLFGHLDVPLLDEFVASLDRLREERRLLNSGQL